MKSSPRIELLERRDAPSSLSYVISGGTVAQTRPLARMVRADLQNRQAASSSQPFYSPYPPAVFTPRLSFARHAVSGLVAQSQASGEPSTGIITITDGPLPPATIAVTYAPGQPTQGTNPSLTFTFVSASDPGNPGPSITYTYRTYAGHSGTPSPIIHISRTVR